MLLARAGVPLLDVAGADLFELLEDGETIEIDEDRILRGGERIALAERLSFEQTAARLEGQRELIDRALADFATNTIEHVREESELSATLLYNVAGRRITSAAVTPIRIDTYEQPRHLLDLSVRFPVVTGMSGKVDLKNLLDSSYEELQGDVVRHRYHTGRSISVGVSWKLQ